MPIRVQTCSITSLVLPPVIQNNHINLVGATVAFTHFLSSCWFIAWQYLPTSFLYDLAFPSSMNLLWAWQCGFLWRRLEYKYGFLCLELLFLLIQKLPEGDADWTSCHLKSAFHIFVFVGRRRFHTSESFSNTRCAIYHLHNHMAGWGGEKKENSLGIFFPLKLILQRMSHCLFPSCKFRRDCTHSCQQPILPLGIHLISHQRASLCLHVRIPSCIACISHMALSA